MFQKRHQSPYIIPVLEDVDCNDIFTVHANLHIVPWLLLGIPHVVILHVHKGGIHIRFGIIVPIPETDVVYVV